MRSFINLLDSAHVPLKDFLTVVAARCPQHNLLGLWKILDDEQMTEFCEVFRSNYVRAPGVKIIEAALLELALLQKWYDLKEALKHGGVEDISRAQKLLDRHWKRMIGKHATHTKNGVKETAEDRARAMDQELAEAREWFKQHKSDGANPNAPILKADIESDEPEEQEPSADSEAWGGRMVDRERP